MQLQEVACLGNIWSDLHHFTLFAGVTHCPAVVSAVPEELEAHRALTWSVSVHLDRSIIHIGQWYSPLPPQSSPPPIHPTSCTAADSFPALHKDQELHRNKITSLHRCACQWLFTLKYDFWWETGQTSRGFAWCPQPNFYPKQFVR